MINLSVEKQIFLAVAYRETNISAIARAMRVAPQNLHRKISGNTLKKEDLCKIAKILGGEYVSYFSFPGGIVLGDKKENKRVNGLHKKPTTKRHGV